MQLLVKIFLPAVIVAAGAFAAKTVRENAPEPRKRPPSEQVRSVDAIAVSTGIFDVSLASRGTVRASNENSVVPEITGKVIGISPHFVAGGEFKTGDILVEFDPKDFEIALTQAQANVAQASATLQEELARSKQAQADWKALGRSGSPSALTARLPQAAAARAALASARAQVQRAELDLSRTRLLAPYDGTVLNAGVTNGEFVNRGTALGRIFESHQLEIRLPLATQELDRLDMTAAQNAVERIANVTLRANSEHSNAETWSASLVRSEGIDAQTQQAFVVARVLDETGSQGSLLRVGQYVVADIVAASIENVFVIPRSALREGREVILVDENDTLQPTAVTVLWTDQTQAAIAADSLPPQPLVVTTVLGSVLAGTPVRATVENASNATSASSRSSVSDDQSARSGGLSE